MTEQDEPRTVVEPLKKVPGISQGVRPNRAMRMLKLNAPICPNSKQEMDRTSDGRWVPQAAAPDKQNCQAAGGKWWIDCEARGHDPYYTNITWYTMEDEVQVGEDGRERVVGQIRIPHKERRLNVNQVPVARRMHNGTGAIDSIKNKGRRRLKDAGHQDVCEFRNCMATVNPKYQSQAFGGYCSKEHFQLVAADQKSVMLPILTGNEGSQAGHVQQKRTEMLARAAWDASADE